MRISDWSSDVCSSDLDAVEAVLSSRWFSFSESDFLEANTAHGIVIEATVGELSQHLKSDERVGLYIRGWTPDGDLRDEPEDGDEAVLTVRSEEHKSELQSLMRLSYAVYCWKKKKQKTQTF